MDLIMSLKDSPKIKKVATLTGFKTKEKNKSPQKQALIYQKYAIVLILDHLVMSNHLISIANGDEEHSGRLIFQ